MKHPNYPEQVLLLGSHDNFRAISRHVIEQTATREPATIRSAHWLFDRWLAAMRSHEGYEEGKLYPYLESRYETSCDGLREGHEMLHRLEVRVRAGFAAANDNADSKAVDGLLAALAAFDLVLDEHLMAEEDLVLPMLLELSTLEFRRYVSLPLAALVPDLARVEGWRD